MSSDRDLWDLLPSASLLGDAIWEQVEDLPEPAQEAGAPAFNLWLIINSPAPSGLWAEVEEETLLLRPIGRDMWHHLVEDHFVQEDGGTALWEEVEEETLIIQSAEDIWEEADDDTLMMAKPQHDLWKEVRPRDITAYRPKRAKNWALKPLRTARGNERYFILKHTEGESYLRITEQQRFLWDLLDGKYTLQDIAVAYLIQFKAFDINGLINFLEELSAYGFIENPLVDVVESADKSLEAARPARRIQGWLARVLQWEFPINGIDGWVTGVYQRLGHIFYGPAGRIVLMALAISGFLTFSFQSFRNDFTATGVEAFGPWGLAGLYAAFAIVVFVHEMAHALTVKHYQREVRRGGALIYLGLLTFFVDTSDIWLSPRRARIAVSWAGPYSGFVLAGLFSLLLFIPGQAIGQFFYQVAFSAYLVSVAQLNPFAKYDGYFILMDWLETPRLREQAIDFVTQSLWEKVRQRETFSREERMYAVFGGLSLLWTIIILGFAIQVWGKRLLGLF